MALKGITKDGEVVEIGTVGAVFQVDENEDGSGVFIQSIKDRAKRAQVESQIVDAEGAGDVRRAEELRGALGSQGEVLTSKGLTSTVAKAK